jgi:hypothetical protein
VLACVSRHCSGILIAHYPVVRVSAGLLDVTSVVGGMDVPYDCLRVPVRVALAFSSSAACRPIRFHAIDAPLHRTWALPIYFLNPHYGFELAMLTVRLPPFPHAVHVVLVLVSSRWCEAQAILVDLALHMSHGHIR